MKYDFLKEFVSLVEKTGKTIAKNRTIIPNNYEVFKEIMQAFQSIADDLGIKEAQLSINKKDMSLKVELIAGWVDLSKDDELFLRLVERANNITFSNLGSERMLIELNYPKIWF